MEIALHISMLGITELMIPLNFWNSTLVFKLRPVELQSALLRGAGWGGSRLFPSSAEQLRLINVMWHGSAWDCIWKEFFVFWHCMAYASRLQMPVWPHVTFVLWLFSDICTTAARCSHKNEWVQEVRWLGEIIYTNLSGCFQPIAENECYLIVGHRPPADSHMGNGSLCLLAVSEKKKWLLASNFWAKHSISWKEENIKKQFPCINHKLLGCLGAATLLFIFLSLVT